MPLPGGATAARDRQTGASRTSHGDRKTLERPGAGPGGSQEGGGDRAPRRHICHLPAPPGGRNQHRGRPAYDDKCRACRGGGGGFNTGTSSAGFVVDSGLTSWFIISGV